MSYHHLTTFERGRIQELLSEGYSHRTIAKKLNRHHSCIDREVHRNTLHERYECEAAQHSYEVRRRKTKPKGKRTVELLEKITECLLATWLPEQIANTATAGMVSFKTIYRWMYSGFLSTVTMRNLRHKGKRRKSEKRGKFSMGVPISERLSEVKKRETFPSFSTRSGALDLTIHH